MRHRLFPLLLALVLPLSACDDEEVGSLGCENLEGGDFTATDFGFTGLDDATLVDDFDPAATLTIGFDDTFDTAFEEPGFADVTATGPFELSEDEVTLDASDPLFRDAEAAGATFACDYDDGAFTLTTDDIGFDFDNDGVFEDATFEADFEPLL